SLGRVEEVLAELLVCRVEAVLIEPVAYVREPRYRRDLDALCKTEVACGDAGVDAVRQPRVPLAARLDDSRRVHAGPGAEGIFSENGIARRNRHAARAGSEAGVLGELREIVPVRAEEFEVDEEEVHL